MCLPSSVNPPGGQRHAVATANSAVSRRRAAARTVVTYSELAPGSSEEDSPSRPKGRSQRNSSDSEFVMSEGEQGLNDAAESSSDDEEDGEANVHVTRVLSVDWMVQPNHGQQAIFKNIACTHAALIIITKCSCSLFSLL